MKVSVCLATYNGAEYIKEQIDSILNQQFVENPDVEMEIIVSDDMSSDDTIKMLEDYHDDRIKIFMHNDKKHYKYYNGLLSCTMNFANAMEHATGDYIFLSDQDDVWYPQKINKTLSVLRAHGGGVCSAAFDCVTMNLQRIGPGKYTREPFFRIKRKNPLAGFSCGMSRSELEYILPMPKVAQHDFYIMLSAEIRNRIYTYDEPCAAHRWSGVHNTSITSSKTPIYVKIWYRIKMYAIVLWRFWQR